jgi:nitric-oxide synthase, bacterial
VDGSQECSTSYSGELPHPLPRTRPPDATERLTAPTAGVFALRPVPTAGTDALASAAAHDANTSESVWSQAEPFIRLFYAEDPSADGRLGDRLAEVYREIAATWTYRHTTAELTFAARVAWRNSSRCIGRLYWRRLQVRDRRDVTTSAEIAAESIAHLREATNGGRIRPIITVFAPDTPACPGPRIISPQLVSYAGYSGADAVTGDPKNAEVTGVARELGWPGTPTPGRFDVLPLIVQASGAEMSWHEIPADAVLEVPLSHPEYRWFTELGLRWYAVPVISDMYLDAGGIRYPAAPFNGWYMGTEIGSRDLGDEARYNQLPIIAGRLNLNTKTNRSLWKDRALTELNLAVLHSFSVAGVTISDHHTESARFLKHIELEDAHGRKCPADWTWIVPPTASSTTPVFHRYYDSFDQTPNFYRHSASWPLALDADSRSVSEPVFPRH